MRDEREAAGGINLHPESDALDYGVTRNMSYGTVAAWEAQPAPVVTVEVVTPIKVTVIESRAQLAAYFAAAELRVLEPTRTPVTCCPRFETCGMELPAALMPGGVR